MVIRDDNNEVRQYPRKLEHLIAEIRERVWQFHILSSCIEINSVRVRRSKVHNTITLQMYLLKKKTVL